MARRIANSTLNASTIDILNVIRQNASYDYQQNVPVVVKASDIPKVGEVIYGTPAFANQFINALVNRIALVRVQSATFNNPYSVLKKGYLEFGETVEDIFVNIATGIDFSAEKASNREFKRTIPDVRSAFHTMNWRVVYPVTIQDEDLRQAFLSIEGVQNLIGKIVDSVYTAAEYDEFLLFKYMLIKSVSHGKLHATAITKGASETDMKDNATEFRGTSNLLQFISSKYNEAQVKNNTPKERQVIFMDAKYNARFDVNVLASAFNMDKADFMGRLFLIDDWNTFDSDRFKVITENSDGLEEITTEELAIMDNVVAILLDEEWFQIYDNNNKFTETYVSSGMYWNYFYHTWKTISYSPFANGVVFISGETTPLDSITISVDGKDTSEVATVLTLNVDNENTADVRSTGFNFIQTEELTKAGIAVQKYGAIIIPASGVDTEITLKAETGGATYTATTTINAATTVDTTIEMTKD